MAGNATLPSCVPLLVLCSMYGSCSKAFVKLREGALGNSCMSSGSHSELYLQSLSWSEIRFSGASTWRWISMPWILYQFSCWLNVLQGRSIYFDWGWERKEFCLWRICSVERVTLQCINFFVLFYLWGRQCWPPKPSLLSSRLGVWWDTPVFDSI